MLKSNITNLQFILDNKPQYSISFDKQQEKKQVPASRTMDYSVPRYFSSVWHENRTENWTPNFTKLETETETQNYWLFGSISVRFDWVFGFRWKSTQGEVDWLYF